MLKPVLIAIAALLTVPVSAQTEARQLFGTAEQGTPGSPEPYGSYARGCVAGAVQLPETGPTWQAMRLSRNRNWGHPDMISFIWRLSQRAVNEAGWNGIYVGDISQPRGGPMLSGHASHQMGLDADIWMLPPSRLDLTRQQREDLSSISVRSEDQRSVNANWTPGHQAVLRAAATDPAVARIFVAAAVKQEMCRTAGPDRDWLRKIRPWWGHNYHFHVRLNCPAGANWCENQAPIPAGDGCDETLAWWTSEEALNPPPADPAAPPPAPRRQLTMADLPQQCSMVIAN